jgi:hypothetical protein
LKNENPELYKNLVDGVRNIVTKNKNSIEPITTIDTLLSKYSKEVVASTKNHFNMLADRTENMFDDMGFDFRSTLKDYEEPILYLRYYHSSYAIAMQEQFRVVGNPNFYKDPAKRLYAWGSSKRPMRLDKEWVNWYKKEYNSKIDGENLRALTINDVRPVDIPYENNPADAQAYISLDAARFLLFSSGAQYDLYLDTLFEEIEELNKKSNLTESDIQQLNKYANYIGEQISVLKPQYFGMQNIDGIDVPTFYKFSVVPLSSALTTNKNLDYVRQIMEDKNINILMFDSANKVGRKYTKGLDMYNEKGEFILKSPEVLSKIDSTIQESSWEYLGIQVDMPKAHDRTPFGTQMRKVITTNIDPNTVYEVGGRKLSGNQVREDFTNLINRKMDIDKAKLMERLGLDESLTIKNDEELQKVKKELIRLSILNSVSWSSVETIDKMDSYDFIQNKYIIQKIANRIVSKNIIKQTTNGDSKVMVSSVAFEKKNKNITQVNRLKFYTNEEPFIEVLLPYKNIEQYREYTYFCKHQGIFKFKNNTPLKIRKSIGYKGTTQAQHCIDNIIIKGFLPAAYGNCVVVPFELLSKNGGSFISTKINLILPTFSIYSLYNPIYSANRRHYITAAKESLPSIIVAVTHHSECQKHQIGFNEYKNTGSTFVKNILSDTTMTIGELLSKFDNRVIENGVVRLDRIYDLDGARKISNSLSQLVSSASDVSIYKYITYTNLNLETIGTILLLTRTGINIEIVLNFISQPGIEEYTRRLANSNSLTIRHASRQTIKNLYQEEQITEIKDIKLEDLKSSLRDNPKSTKQVTYITLFKQISRYAYLLSEFQNITRFDTKGTGNSLEENEINLFKYDIFNTKYKHFFTGIEQMLDPKYSFEARMREEARNSNNLFNSIFKLENYLQDNLTGLTSLKNTQNIIYSLFQEKTSKKAYFSYKLKTYFNSYLLQRILEDKIGKDNIKFIIQNTLYQLNKYQVNNLFLKKLKSNNRNFYIHNAASMDSDEMGELCESFWELNNNPETTTLANNIIYASLLQFSLVNSPFTTMNIISSELLLAKLGIDLSNPMKDIYEKVLKLDGSLDLAVERAKIQMSKPKNHFDNNLL